MKVGGKVNAGGVDLGLTLKSITTPDVVTPVDGVSYIKIGRLVTVMFNVLVNDDVNLGIPSSIMIKNAMLVTCRNDDDGSFATFWIANDTLSIFNAVNYKPNHRYAGTFSYISAS